MQALIIGGVLGALAGMIFTLPRGAVQPANYGTELTFFLYTCLLLGGLATVSRPGRRRHDLLGGALADPGLLYGADRGRATSPCLNTIQAGQLRYILVGVALMLLMIFRPQGVLRQQEGAGIRMSEQDRIPAGAAPPPPDQSPVPNEYMTDARPSLPTNQVPAARKRDPILVADNVTRQLRRPQRRRRRAPRDPAAPDHGADRPERRRQDHAVQPAHRLRQAADRASGRSKATSLAGVASYKVARMGMVRTFQLTKVMGKLTVMENMRLGAPEPARRERCSRPSSRASGAARSRRSPSRPSDLLERFKLDAKKRRLRRRRSPAASASCSRWPAR